MNVRKLAGKAWRFARKGGKSAAPSPGASGDGYKIAYEPDLVPPPRLMRTEGIHVLEEWFRWAEEWSMLLRVYGRITRSSRVLEIGCGLGRIAFPIRYLLSGEGTYDGFEICREKVEFLQRHFQPAHRNFRFVLADIHNTFYNPAGTVRGVDYRFPYDDGRFDIVFAASVFTHMLPDTAAHYFRETARVLEPNGRALFSFFLLDHYRPGQPRPGGFARDVFAFDHAYGDYGPDFAVAVPSNPEETTAYRAALVARYAADAGLVPTQEAIPGIWSGSSATWVGAQDLVVLKKQ